MADQEYTSHACTDKPVVKALGKCLSHTDVFHMTNALKSVLQAEGDGNNMGMRVAQAVECLVRVSTEGGDPYTECAETCYASYSDRSVHSLLQSLVTTTRRNISKILFDQQGKPTSIEMDDNSTNTVSAGGDMPEGHCPSKADIVAAYLRVITQASGGGGDTACKQFKKATTKCTICATCISVVVTKGSNVLLIGWGNINEESFAGDEEEPPAPEQHNPCSGSVGLTIVGVGTLDVHYSLGSVMCNYERAGDDAATTYSSGWVAAIAPGGTGCDGTLTGTGAGANKISIKVRVGGMVFDASDIEDAHDISDQEDPICTVYSGTLEGVDLEDSNIEMPLSSGTYIFDSGSDYEDCTAYIKNNNGRAELHIEADQLDGDKLTWVGLNEGCGYTGNYIRTSSHNCSGPVVISVASNG